MVTRPVVFAALLLGPLLLAGCATSYLAPDVTPSTTESANVYLYLSNQSTEQDVVTLAVYVDGKLQVRRTMRTVFHSRRAHDIPDEIPLRLAPGPHTVRIVAEGMGVSEEARVTVGDAPVYVDAGYDYSTRDTCVPAGAHIGIFVSTQRPGFC